jgi:peptidoglycan/LPS O-acetylase OafA/YrhL
LISRALIKSELLHLSMVTAPALQEEPRLSSRRIPELDGLRAFAILPVLMVHLAPRLGPLSALAPIWRRGWVGVDLFFVLSGYLITGILLDTIGRPHFYRNFIARRTLRIFPLYYLCLTLFTTAVYFYPHRGPWESLMGWGNPGWFAVYMGNFVAAFRNRNCPIFSFDPLWSLQVEEQFYVFYPLLIASCGLRTLRRVLVACVLIALLLRSCIVLSVGSRFGCYVLMPCRMDALALGGIVAMMIRSNSMQPSAKVLRVCFMICATASFCVMTLTNGDFSNWFMMSLGYTLVALAFACLLALVVSSPQTLVVRLLRWRPLVYIGQISYGLYLLHVPAARVGRSLVSHFVALNPDGTWGSVVGIAAAFTAAAVSWTIFESRVLTLKDRFGSEPQPCKSP